LKLDKYVMPFPIRNSIDLSIVKRKDTCRCDHSVYVLNLSESSAPEIWFKNETRKNDYILHMWNMTAYDISEITILFSCTIDYYILYTHFYSYVSQKTSSVLGFKALSECKYKHFNVLNACSCIQIHIKVKI